MKEGDQNMNEIFVPCELDEEFLMELLPAFLDEIKNDFELLKTSYENEDLEQVEKSAHKIKGTAACYGAKLVSSQALNLEKSIVSKEGLGDQVASLGDSIKRTDTFAHHTMGL